MLASEIARKADLTFRFDAAIRYFQERGHVVFVNESVRFWEKHGFVQQSLARLLTQNGVSVTWYDAFGWRSYEPVLSWNSPLLKVRSLFRFPGDRFNFIQNLNDRFVARALVEACSSRGKKAVVWIQASLSDSIVELIPWIDVYSVFDDPYRHCTGEPLLEKARLITCQNSYAYNRFHEHYPKKTLLLYPPFECNPDFFREEAPVQLPSTFPKKVMGYIGSFTGEATDFALIEYLLKNAPEWGVLLAGRTDAIGLRHLERLKSYSNFIHFEWLPPDKLFGLWSAIHVTILPYRQGRINDGAFPVKILESFCYDIPVVATSVYKTSSLQGYITRATFPDEFLRAVEREFKSGYSRSGDLYRYFSEEMDPRLHLIRVSDSLKTNSKG